MKRRLLASVLTLVMVLSLLPTVAWASNEGDEDSVALTYDDRYELGNKTVKSITGDATSYQVGTSTLDTAILREDNGYLIATGTGTATVTWDDDTQTTFMVTPAPISLVMITGHSLGVGQVGNMDDSVLCDAGQAYIIRTNRIVRVSFPMLRM